MSARFQLVSNFEPKGDQPQAIVQLMAGPRARRAASSTVFGITGSGKTFTIATVIEKSQNPTLIMAPNKTLAAQLYGEMKELFPEKRGRAFPSATTTITSLRPTCRRATPSSTQKDAIIINDAIDRMRHFGDARGLLSRPDVIIVASVSCILRHRISARGAITAFLIDLKVGEDFRRE